MNQPPGKHRLYLTGYRGTGKTTVGRILAARLGGDCVDLDDRIETAAGMTIREIFAAGGEATFRDWESRCLEQIARERPPTQQSAEDEADRPRRCRVIALGGGAILREANRRTIAGSGRCVWLVASPAAIALRLSADGTTAERRPALTELPPSEEIAQVLRQREPLYRRAADFSVDTEGCSPQEIADRVANWWMAAG